MPSDTAKISGLQKLNHIVVVVLENWSFDSLYGEFSGAAGLSNAESAPPQIDDTGVAYQTLPQTETHLPQTLPNAPFALDSYIPSNADTSTDLTANFYEEQRQDETDFLTAAQNGSLPAVSFLKPAAIDDEHPNYTNVINGESHVLQLIDAVRNGPNWADSAIIVTYDENGGFWDHVSPPAGDQWGPGTRVPTLVVSPFAKKGFVDTTVYDTSSILALIEKRWGLEPLGTRDRAAADSSATEHISPVISSCPPPQKTLQWNGRCQALSGLSWMRVRRNSW